MNTKIKYFISIMIVLTIIVISSRFYIIILYRNFSSISELAPDFFALFMQIIIYKLNVNKWHGKFIKYFWPTLLVIGFILMTFSFYYFPILKNDIYLRSKSPVFFYYPFGYSSLLIIYSLLMRYLIKRKNGIE